MAQVQLDSRTVDAAMVQAGQAPTPTGYIQQVVLFDPTAGAWVTTTPTVQKGQQMGVDVVGWNTSAYILSMSIVFTWTAPDGTTGTNTSGPFNVSPNCGQGFYSYCNADQVGTYTCTIELQGKVQGEAGEMAVLDRKDVTPAQVVEAQAPPSIWEQWMPTLGSAMAMALLGSLSVAMMKQGKK